MLINVWTEQYKITKITEYFVIATRVYVIATNYCVDII
jgi:hypothetical protein